MTHYVCKGLCGSESVLPGICDSSSCEKTGKPLMECKCADGKHESIGRLASRGISDDSPAGKGDN
ncbi:MAG: hypothetical protein WC250_00120 [Candidatus Paceibacterota bacterium]|jgi:hypothetical protein